jgi:predicted dithiol-disulfide oxidoreductase (DUF899 family)
VKQTRLDEPTEYEKRPEELPQSEVDLMHHREKLASLRRQLPEGTAVEDYLDLTPHGRGALYAELRY